MAASTKEAARAFIDKLRQDNGGLTKDDREYLELNRPWVLETFDNIRRKLGVSTRTLAEQLYAKDTRFVYELIQNAEDNHYSVADGLGDPPWLRFNLYQDRVEIDSNEDGFSEANIRAICSIGESTKTNVQGYIGEKGIGFKSVFKAAYKVHVQSGPYSFAFEHQRDGNDNGLGMVTPMNEPHRDIPNEVRTRMILYLLENCDPISLKDDLLDLPDTLLLFLKKLKKLSIRIALTEDSPEERHYSLSLAGKRATIQKSTAPTVSTSSRDYLITRRWVSNMPHDNVRKGISEAEVVLAFPLDAGEIPIIEEQHVFAFLPLRKVGYKFLIQSDFVTQANREDVFDIKWNNHLLTEVSKAFIQSIEAFLQSPSLRHRWVRYIPTDRIADEFWGRLQRQIFNDLLSRKAFFSDANARIVAPSQLRMVPNYYRDADKKPLMPDLVDGHSVYISEDYDPSLELPVLRKMNTSMLSTQDFLDRVKRDLERSEPRIKTKTSLEVDWHARVADQMLAAIQTDGQHRTFLQKLLIVPLNNGKWVQSFNASIYLPTSGGVAVPADLPLNVVNAEALQNESRRKLFSQLGVTELAPTQVFPWIEIRYRSPVTLTDSLAHVKFMFWHHEQLPATGLNIWLVSDKGNTWFKPGDTSQGWTYHPLAKGPYTASVLFQASVPEKLQNRMHFIHSKYYDMLRQCQERNSRKGFEWFRDYFQIQYIIQLSRRGSRLAMSHEFDYVIQSHPESMLGVLEVRWSSYNKSTEWDDKLKKAEIPILNSNQRKQLGSTYLPLPKLRQIVSRLGLEEDFGFIQELWDITDIDSITWSFLQRFGVTIEDNVAFYLALLAQARKKEDVKAEVVFEIYSNLQKFSAEEDMKKIKKAFERDVFFIPPGPLRTKWKRSWAYPDWCVWKGPEWFTDRIRVSAVENYDALFSLFVRTLGLGDAAMDEFLEYLYSIQASEDYLTSQEEEGKIPMLYDALRNIVKDADSIKLVRADFEDREMVYNPKDRTWHAPSSCIWAEDRIQLPGKVSLATIYKGKQTFFTSVLGVTKPDLQMHILSLIQKAADAPQRDAVLQEVRNICAFSPTPNDLKKLDECKCFPVILQTGMLYWLSRSDDFAIVDRREHAESFKGKIKMLDFSLEDVHKITSFLDGMGLQDRYLSTTVKRATTAENGSLHQVLTEGLRRKSYAICRYAAHFHSRTVLEDPAAVQSMLAEVEVYTSTSISMSLSVVQNGQRVTVDQEEAYCHLEAEGGKLKLYIPKDKLRRQICFATQLPVTILEHLGASTKRAGDLCNVIAERSLSVINQVLKINGIIEVPGLEGPDNDSGYESDSSEEGAVAHDPPLPRAPTPLHESVESVVSQTASSLGGLFPTTILRTPSATPTPSVLDSVRPPSPPEHTDHYRKLLSVLIHQARHLSDLPRAGELIRTVGTNDHGLDLPLAVASPYVGEKEFKIGAAGELFVFEILKSLALPGFSLDQWQSTIRGRVNIHDEYRHLWNWAGLETADIVYQDHDSTLTEKLINLGYFDGTVWRGRNPTYYIEVKSTMASLEAPFFCSQPQADRMDRLQLLASGTASNDVYLIVRVFQLGSFFGTGCKIYLDPATLRRQGDLDFKADKYAVTPRTSRF